MAQYGSSGLEEDPGRELPPVMDYQQGQLMAPLRGLTFDRPSFSHVRLDIQPGQRVRADAKAMLWMDGNIHVETQCGDCGPACTRSCAGESCCQNVFSGPGQATFSHQLPGDMIPFMVTPGNGWILDGGCFVCGTEELSVEGRFTSCGLCLCTREGPFFTHIVARDRPGMFYAGSYGAITRHEIPAGKTLMLAAGLFFAANEKADIEISLPGGLSGCICGREGFAMKFKGPCVVFSQNRDPYIWAAARRGPRRRQQRQGAAAGMN